MPPEISQSVKDAIIAAPLDTTNRELAARFGINRATVGIIRLRGGRPRRKAELTEAQKKAILSENLDVTLRELAKEIGVGISTIGNMRRRHGVKVGSRGSYRDWTPATDKQVDEWRLRLSGASRPRPHFDLRYARALIARLDLEMRRSPMREAAPVDESLDESGGTQIATIASDEDVVIWSQRLNGYKRPRVRLRTTSVRALFARLEMEIQKNSPLEQIGIASKANWGERLRKWLTGEK